MKLSRGEYCGFSLSSRVQLLKESGVLLFNKRIKNKQVSIYQLYDFYVEVIYDINSDKIERAEPITSAGMIKFYDDMDD